MMNRIGYIDLAKGVGIILVILGHGLLQNFAIEVFHMPLFFFLAGLTFTPPTTTNGSLGVFVLKKFNRIFIPWVFFSLVSGIAEWILGRISEDAEFNGPLWFLPTLLTAVVFYTTIHLKVESKLALNAIVFTFPFVAYALYKYTDVPSILPFDVIRALEATFYMHLGYSYRTSRLANGGRAILMGSVFVYAACVYVSMRNYDVHGVHFYNGSTYTYSLVLPIVASVTAIYSVISLCRNAKRIQLINWMGANSLVIYGFHFPIQERLNQVVFYFFTNLHITSFPAKLLIVLVAYFITVVTSSMIAITCKKYIPKLTGYSSLIPIINEHK